MSCALNLSECGLSKSEDLIQITSSSPERMSYARKLETSFRPLSISVALQSISLVGNLLGIAYAASKGTKPCAKILEVMVEHQTLQKKSINLCNEYILASLQALRIIKAATTSLENRNPDQAFKLIRVCIQTAQVMATAADQHCMQISDLCLKTKTALVSTTEEKTLAQAERQTIQKKLSQAEERQSKLTSLSESLAKDLEQARASERAAEKRTDREIGRGMAAAVAKILTTPFSLGNGATNQTESYVGCTQNEVLARERRIAIQKEIRESNGELAETIQTLQGLTSENQSLQRAITSLVLAIQALGKVQTIFQTSKLFWNQISRQMQSAADDATVCGLMGNEELELMKSCCINFAWVWAVIGKISLDASGVLTGIDHDFDGLMKQLPTLEESIRLMKSTSNAILKQLTYDEAQPQ